MPSLVEDLLPTITRGALETQQPYRQYRSRVGVVLQKGFDIYDFYKTIQPILFAAGLLGAGLSGWAWFKRRKQGAEVHVIYPVSATANLVLAYLTRPDWLLPSATQQQADAQGISPVIAWADREAAQYAAKDPSFPDSTYKRLVSLPGMKETYEAIPSYLRSAIV